MRRTLAFLLILLLVSVSAFAQDFIAFADTSVLASPCTTISRNITIQNTQTFTSTYDLSVDGEGADFLTFLPIQFTLASQQAQVVAIFYTIPCTAKPGRYPIEIIFSDGFSEQSVVQELEIALPDTLFVSTEELSKVTTPCETVNFPVKIHNPSNFTEIYTLSGEGHLDLFLPEPTFVLQANKEKIVDVTVTPKDCTESGTYEITLFFESEKSVQHKELALELIITATDIPILAEGVGTIRTDYVDSTTPLTVRNIGDKTTRYLFSIEGPAFAKINPKELSIPPGQTREVALRLAPSENDSIDKYPLTFIATVSETGVEYTKELTIKLAPPTAFEMRPLLYVSIGVLALIVLIFAILLIRYLVSAKFKDKIRRWKERRQKARELLAQKKQAALNKKQEIAAKRAEQQAALREKIAKKLERQYKKDNYVIARKELIVGKNKNFPLSRIFGVLLVIFILALVTIFSSLLVANLPFVILGLTILVIIFALHRIRRVFIIDKKFRILLPEEPVNIPCWKKGLSLLTLTAQKATKNLSLKIKKQKIRIVPSPFVYQTFSLRTNALASAHASFAIPKKWLIKRKLHPQDVRLGRFVNNSWISIDLEKTGETKKVVYFTSESIGHGTYCLYARAQPAKSSKNNKLFIIVSGVICVAVIIALAVFLLPSAPPAGIIPAQTWKQDTVHTFDIGPYFKDPDNDTLTFSATGATHVTIDVIGTRVVLTPEEGWVGEEIVRFIGQDGKGGSVASNSVPLRVQKTVFPLRLQPFVALTLAILAIAALLLIVFALQKKQ